MFFASGLLALLPSVAHGINKSPIAYGVLLGCFGCGAVIGALAMQRAPARWSAETVVSSGIAIFGLMTAAAGILRFLPAICVGMLIAGAAWIVFISLFNVVVLTHTPGWVQARILAVSMLVFQGAMAAGSATWGAVAARMSIQGALVWAGLGTIVSTFLGLFVKLPEGSVDLTPWVHWRLPAVLTEGATASDAGPILVTVEYPVTPAQEAAFIKAIHKYGRIRRRDGAYRWGVFRDLEKADQYLEVFLVDSWAEHVRQHHRSTIVDRAAEERVHSCLCGTPTVRHLAYTESES
jgi:MFS family permease